MIDMLNQPLTVGDEVAFPDRTFLRTGRITKVGPKMVIIESRLGNYRRYFKDVIKLPR